MDSSADTLIINILVPLMGVLIFLILLVIAVIIPLISIIYLRMRYCMTIASKKECCIKCLYFLIGNSATTGKHMAILTWYVYYH